MSLGRAGPLVSLWARPTVSCWLVAGGHPAFLSLGAPPKVSTQHSGWLAAAWTSQGTRMSHLFVTQSQRRLPILLCILYYQVTGSSPHPRGTHYMRHECQDEESWGDPRSRWPHQPFPPRDVLSGAEIWNSSFGLKQWTYYFLMPMCSNKTCLWIIHFLDHMWINPHALGLPPFLVCLFGEDNHNSTQLERYVFPPRNHKSQA